MIIPDFLQLAGNVLICMMLYLVLCNACAELILSAWRDYQWRRWDKSITEFELRDRITCNVTCSCKQSAARSSVVCPHAAALLYHWITHPLNFTTSAPASASPVPLPFEQETAKSTLEGDLKENPVPETKQSQPLAQTKPVQALQTSFPLSD